jgi:hypothetical protein
MAKSKFYGTPLPQIPEEVQQAMEVLVLFSMRDCRAGQFGKQPLKRICRAIETATDYLGLRRFDDPKELNRAITAIEAS